ncbi:MAG: YibE/F family protein, partial [Pauljensenia sp.]
MSHSHGHGGPAPASRSVVISLAVVMTLILMVTVFALVLLWPSSADLPERRSFLYEGAREVSGTVTGIESPGDVQTGENAQVGVRLDETGSEIDVQMGPTLVTDDIVGAKVRLVEIPAYTDESSGLDPGTDTGTDSGATGEDGSLLDPGTESGAGNGTDLGTDPTATTAAPSYMFMDFHRGVPLLALGIVLAVLVIAVARLKGLAALCGLVAALATIWFFTLPALLAGRPSVPVALTTASAVLFIVVYLAHGISVKSSTALLGTFAGIALVTLLAAWAIPAAHLLPGASEEMSQLAYYAHNVDLRGVLLCGMVLGGVGVLNDVTITQASSVWELRAAAPEDSRWTIFVRAMHIGRDHIASTVYTIAVAYA